MTKTITTTVEETTDNINNFPDLWQLTTTQNQAEFVWPVKKAISSGKVIFINKNPSSSHGYDSYSKTDISRETISNNNEIDEINSEIKGIKSMLTELQLNMNDIHKVLCQPQYIELRNIPYEQAKEEIRLFFKENHGKEFYPSDLMQELGIDFNTASQVCAELESEGNIQ